MSTNWSGCYVTIQNGTPYDLTGTGYNPGNNQISFQIAAGESGGYQSIKTGGDTVSLRFETPWGIRSGSMAMSKTSGFGFSLGPPPGGVATFETIKAVVSTSKGEERTFSNDESVTLGEAPSPITATITYTYVPAPFWAANFKIVNNTPYQLNLTHGTNAFSPVNNDIMILPAGGVAPNTSVNVLTPANYSLESVPYVNIQTEMVGVPNQYYPGTFGSVKGSIQAGPASGFAVDRGTMDDSNTKPIIMSVNANGQSWTSSGGTNANYNYFDPNVLYNGISGTITYSLGSSVKALQEVAPQKAPHRTMVSLNITSADGKYVYTYTN